MRFLTSTSSATSILICHHVVSSDLPVSHVPWYLLNEQAEYKSEFASIKINVSFKLEIKAQVEPPS